MKHEKTRSLYSYWDKVRGTRTAPRRLEIEPDAIAPLLPNLFILERIDAKSYRFRLAGTHVCGYCGKELRDRLFTSLWAAEEREAVESLLFTVTEDAAGVVAGLEGSERGGRSAMFELLLLPLSTGQGVCNRVLGSMSALESPYWLGGWPITGYRLKTMRILWPDGHPPVLVDNQEMDHAVNAPLAGRRALQRRFSVIDGGRSNDPVTSR